MPSSENLFAFKNKLLLEGKTVEGGAHRVEIRRTGHGPLHWNAYRSYFSLEDFITKAGPEIRSTAPSSGPTSLNLA